MSIIVGPVDRARPGWSGLPTDRSRLRARAVRDGLIVAGWITSAALLVAIPLVGRSLGYDALSYWFADLMARYELARSSLYELGAFRYSPPIGIAFSLFGSLPWWLFLTLWSAVLAACVAWLGGRRMLLLFALPPVALEVYHGNIHLLLAVAVALGFRHPWTWAFVLLTKVTPGVALLWFAVRREWRALAIALAATGLLIVLSALLAPELWLSWWEAVESSVARPADLAIPPPLPGRLVLAALLVTWGARTDRAWTVGVAAMLGLPNLWPHGLVVALAAVPAFRDGSEPGGSPSLGRLVASVAVALALAGSLALVLGPAIRSVIEDVSLNVLAQDVPGSPSH